jgi:Omp85 superfamily domain
LRHVGAAILVLTAGAGFAAGQVPSPTPTPTVSPSPVPEITEGPVSPAGIGAPPPAQPPPAPEPSPAEEPTPAPAPEPEKSSVFPSINVYLPEGRADIRLVKPIRNSLFENQIDYNFVSGDISAFLRYKYYSRSATSTFSFFDSIEFEELERFSNEFSRTRGALYLQRRPLNFYNRLYGLLQFDRLTFSRPIDHPDANRTNVYIKLGYQFGTPSDERSNAVVGEARDRIFNLFTAYREVGPRGRGLSVAATWGFDFLGGDYRYVKAEMEALQAIALPKRNRLVLRLHGGYFPYKKRVREEFDPLRGTPFSIPRYELFKLNGRQELKGYRGTERGPNQVHLTAEHVVPIFTEPPRRIFGLDWTSLYAVGYVGTGNVGNETSIYTELSDYKVDVGAGFEAALSWRRYRAFLGILAAKTLVNDVGGGRILVTLKTYR